MFRFHWNHHQALLQKCVDPLRRITEMRYGIPDAKHLGSHNAF